MATPSKRAASQGQPTARFGLPRADESARGGLSSRALWTGLIGVTAVVLLLAVFAAEFGLRWLQQRKHGTAGTVEQQYRIDEQLGLRVPIANLRLPSIQTNSLGFRGPEIAVPKPEGRLRLAFLGASTTWCAEVSSNAQVWAQIVAEDLQRAFPASHIDFVNGGVPGYTVRSSLKNLEARVAPLRPDVIVIYHAANDMSAELRRIAAEKGVYDRARVESDSWLARHTLLFNLAEKNIRVWTAQHRSERRIDTLEVDWSTLGAAFRTELRQLVRGAQRTAAVVAIATFSTRLRAEQSAKEQLDAAASALYYMPFMTPESLLQAYARYNEVIREVANETGALLIEGEHDIPGDAAHFADSVHFTDAGSRRMAARVSQALARDSRVEAVVRAMQ